MRLMQSLLMACLMFTAPMATAAGVSKATVFKDPSCGCCNRYIDYLKANGFSVKAVDRDDMVMVKNGFHIPFPMRSCHTMLIDGYVVEGHVPVAAIHKLLDQHPKIEGVALPRMPATSPGMGPEKPGSLTIYVLGGDGEHPKIFSVE